MSRHAKSYWFFLPGLLLAATFTLGCEPQQMGGPGANEAEQGTATPGEQEEVFTATVSSEALDLAQGEAAEVTVSIDRGDDFAQIVQIETAADEGLMISADKTTLSADETDATLTVEATANADTRDYSLEVSLTPPMGEPVVKVINVTVTAAEPEESLEEEQALEDTQPTEQEQAIEEDESQDDTGLQVEVE